MHFGCKKTCIGSIGMVEFVILFFQLQLKLVNKDVSLKQIACLPLRWMDETIQ